MYKEYREYISCITQAILKDDNKIVIIDKNNDKIHIENISNILKDFNMKEKINYEVFPNKIAFENGSVIEMLETKSNNKIIRGKKRNLTYDWDMWENQQIDTDNIVKKYLQEYPDKFVEELWGIKLYDYQKIILRLLNKN